MSPQGRAFYHFLPIENASLITMNDKRRKFLILIKKIDTHDLENSYYIPKLKVLMFSKQTSKGTKILVIFLFGQTQKFSEMLTFRIKSISHLYEIKIDLNSLMDGLFSKRITDFFNEHTSM